MKRFGMLASTVFLASVVGGCGGGIEEGPPKEGSMEPASQDFKEYMKKNAGKMAGKGMAKPKAAQPGTEAHLLPKRRKSPDRTGQPKHHFRPGRRTIIGDQRDESITSQINPD